MDFEVLTTGRLLLRKLTPEDYNFVFSQYDEAAIKQFFGCRNETEFAEEQKKHAQGLSMYRKSFLVFQLLDKLTKEVIGWCGFHTWYVLHYRAEVGYVLSNENRRGQGLMKEALHAVLGYGFQQMNLKRIEAMTSPENVASIKLVTSMGFTLEGRLREHYLVGDSMEDSLLFSLLQREFESNLQQQPLKRVS